jgi:regulator of PEP synthase PpsR (kinase-PPPase family)
VSELDDPLMHVFVVSDGTGDTGTAAVRAAMVQFRSPWRLRVFGDIRYVSEARRVISLAADAKAMVIFSLVDGRVIETLQREAKLQGVVAVDLLGPLIAKVAQRLHTEPRHQPGLLHSFSDDYFERIEAVEFAVHHDDGANVHTLHQADIVLTGVSRTSKTPLCMYLAQRGYKTGNVPLVPTVKPPRELMELDKKRVFGLTIDTASLMQIRQARLTAIKGPPRTRYTDSAAVDDEIEESRRFFRRNGWRAIDITGKAVEENAARIIEYYEYSRGADG